MRRSGAGRLALVAVILGLGCTGAVIAGVRPSTTVEIAGALATLQGRAGWVAWLAVAACQVVAALCGIIPASMIAVAAGMIYGTWSGFLVSAPSIMLGALAAFLLSRSLFRDRVARTLDRDHRLAGLDDAVGRDGWRLVCLLRLSPVMPFALTSYALGVTSLDLGSYLLGTTASLPPLVLYTALGSLARHGMESVSSGGNILRLIVPAVSLAATILLAVRVGRMVSKALRRSGLAVPQ